MTDRELMQQALDALANFDLDVRLKVIPALRARLAQPDLITPADVKQLARIEKLVEDVDPYTAPPQREWQGLTDGQKKMAYALYGTMTAEGFVKSLETKLREKNSG